MCQGCHGPATSVPPLSPAVLTPLHYFDKIQVIFVIVGQYEKSTQTFIIFNACFHNARIYDNGNTPDRSRQKLQREVR